MVEFVPKYVKVIIDTFKTAAQGEGMQLQIARLREVLKACAEAVRATKNALKNGPSVNTWDLWQSTELSNVLAEVAQSKKIEKAGSLSSAIRNLMDSINQGSGRAKVRSAKDGEPALLPTDQDGKPLTKLDQRQIKKAIVRSEKATQRAAQDLKKENKKRKRQGKEEKPVVSATQAVSEDHGASTSEDSD